jgi:hypothetical protein
LIARSVFCGGGEEVTTEWVMTMLVGMGREDGTNKVVTAERSGGILIEVFWTRRSKEVAVVQVRM